MRIFLTLLCCLVAFASYGQGLWRNFFTTNHAPIVEVVAGSNATVQATTPNVFTRRFTVNAIPSGAGATNVTEFVSTSPLTNQVYGSNVVGGVTQATHATNADNATFVLTATLTNLVYGSNVVGAVAQATHATNADQATHATNADIATFVSTPVLTNGVYASNVVSGGQIINGGVETNQLNNGYLQLTGDKRQTTFDLGSGTNVSNLSPGLTNYILGLVAAQNVNYYFSSVTNALGITVSTNCSTMIDVPVAAAATNSIAVPSSGVYFLSRVTTNTVTRIEAGPIWLQTYVFVSGGGGVQTITAHPEIWVWLAGDTMVQLATSGPQLFSETAVPTIFTTTMNVSTATNLPAGSHILLRWFADAVANSPTWNFVIGGVYDSHISVNVAHQSGTYIGSFIGDGGGLTNISLPQSAITNQTPRVVTCVINDGGSVISSGNKGLPVEIPYAASVSAATIMADQIGSIAIACYRTNSTGYPPTSSTPIFTNYLTATNWSRDTTFTGAVSTNIAVRDFIRFNVLTNAATVTNITIQLTLQP